MKKLFTLGLCSLFLLQLSAQDATFERFLSVKDSFLNGKTTAPSPQIFKDSGFIFSAVYDTSFGGYWVNGFAISSMTDTVNGTAANLYSSASGEGSGGSTAYGIVQNNSFFKMDFPCFAIRDLSSFDVNNTYYAYHVMKNGNQFAKKFNSTDKDSFTLWIYRYSLGIFIDSTRVDLANFTSDNPSEHFILDTWTTVNFIPRGEPDSISFKLVSSDNGQFGMNTPAFFAIDNLKGDCASSIASFETHQIRIFPNPSNGVFQIEGFDQMMMEGKIYDSRGQLTSCTIQNNFLDLSHLPAGIYILTLQTETLQWQEKLIIR